MAGAAPLSAKARRCGEGSAWRKRAELSLRQSLTALPAPSGREPLARPEAFRFSRKLYRHAKGPISEDDFPRRGSTPSVLPLRVKPPSPRGRLFAVAGSFLIAPNTLATGFKPWLSLRGKTSPAPGEDVTAGDKKGNLARERLRGRWQNLDGALPERIKSGSEAPADVSDPQIERYFLFYSWQAVS